LFLQFGSFSGLSIPENTALLHAFHNLQMQSLACLVTSIQVLQHQMIRESQLGFEEQGAMIE
jgi:hypothetical protein